MKKIALQLFSLMSVCACSALPDSEYARIIMGNNPDWIQSWDENPLLNLKKQSTSPFEAFDTGDYLRPENQHFYSCSPKGIFVVDIYSYSISIEDTVVNRDEPDVEVLLMNTQNHTQTRVLFEGTYSSYEDVVWKTDSCFIVLGSYSESESLSCPLIIIFDIKNKKYDYYVGSASPRKYDYLEYKFKIMKQ